jgi:hypothetical protein
MELTDRNVRNWLLGYAWAEDTEAAKTAVVGCIMAQDGWRTIAERAEQFAGAAEQPGPPAFSRGIEFALSSLYECHSGPHMTDCPQARS